MMEHNNNNNNNNNLSLEKDVHKNLDHYHDNEHFDKDGKHDQVEMKEFKTKNFLWFSRRNMIFKITLTAMFLGLACAVSAIDMLLESFAIPVDTSGQVTISLRFLDLAVIFLSVAVVGPFLAIFIGFVEPWIHDLIHGMEHGWLQPITDGITNAIIVMLLVVFFYVLFRNSPIHKKGSIQENRIKRFTPGIFIVVIASIVGTLFILLNSYIMSNISGHTGVDEDDLINFSNFKEKWWIIFSIFGIESLHFIFGYILFVNLEWRMRPINHRFSR